MGAAKGDGLEEEAMRVVGNMPDWKPGKHKGQHVAVQFNLPIRFTLDDDKQKKDNIIFTTVEVPPTYPGGEDKLAGYLSSQSGICCCTGKKDQRHCIRSVCD